MQVSSSNRTTRADPLGIEGAGQLAPWFHDMGDDIALKELLGRIITELYLVIVPR